MRAVRWWIMRVYLDSVGLSAFICHSKHILWSIRNKITGRSDDLWLWIIGLRGENQFGNCAQKRDIMIKVARNVWFGLNVNAVTARFENWSCTVDQLSLESASTDGATLFMKHRRRSVHTLSETNIPNGRAQNIGISGYFLHLDFWAHEAKIQTKKSSTSHDIRGPNVRLISREEYLAATPPIYIKISMYGELAHSALSVGEPLVIIFNITTAPRLVPFIRAMS